MGDEGRDWLAEAKCQADKIGSEQSVSAQHRAKEMAVAFALIDIAESLRGLRSLLDRRDWTQRFLEEE